MFNLVVTCVGSKNFDGPSIRGVIDDLLKQDINNNVETLFTSWKERLNEQSTSYKTQAASVYKGPMWNSSIEAFKKIKEPSNLWIISCGYGFINYKQEITSYHATFKPRADDTLLRNDYFFTLGKKDVKKQWWNLLTDKTIVNCSGMPKSIHELVNNSKADDVVMLAAGSDYYEAIYDDLDMIDVSNNMPKLVLIGIQKRGEYYIPEVPKKIEPFVIPYTDGRKLREFLGCGAIQIHPKSASYLIDKYNETGKMEGNLP